MLAGIALLTSPALAVWAISVAVFGIACIVLAYGILAKRVFTKLLGVVMALVLGVLLILYVALNGFLFLRMGLTVSLAACGAGLVGLWFCWLTATVARSQSEIQES